MLGYSEKKSLPVVIMFPFVYSTFTCQVPTIDSSVFFSTPVLKIRFLFLKTIYFKKYLFIYLAVLGFSCGTQDL